jgi:hypothetical protein
MDIENMRTLRAGIAAFLLVALMGMTLTGCGSDSESSTESSAALEVAEDETVSGDDSSTSEEDADDEEVSVEEAEDATDFLKQDAVFTWGDDAADTTTQDATEAAQGNSGSSNQSVSTQYVVVTEAGGAAVTDAKGTTVTEVVTSAGNSSSGNETTTSYTPAIDNFRSYWLDMTKKDGVYDKVFNGDFLVVTFKIKDGTPDGNYAISMGDQDFVNWDEEQLDVKTVDGYVTVGDVAQSVSGQAQPGQFTIQATSVKGNVGDEVEVVFKVTDNPGLVGYVFNFQYDKNALEIVGARIGDDCSDIIKTVND